MRFRVVCGRGETIATLRPTSVFTSVDFPALGRPTMATNPDLKDIAWRYCTPTEGVFRIYRRKLSRGATEAAAARLEVPWRPHPARGQSARCVVHTHTLP